MKIEKGDIAEYVERFLNSLFSRKIHIEVLNDKYVVGNIEKYKIYDFWNKDDEELLNDFENNSFKGDYVGTIFFFLSGYWEYIHNDIKDNYNRFSAKESFSFKKGIIEEPVVDILVNVISKKLGITFNKFFLRPKAFLTHDIDYLRMFTDFNLIRYLAGDILKRRDFKSGFDKIRKKLTGKDPHSVNNLLSIHEKHNTKGTFFFMPDIQIKETIGGYNPLREKNYLKKIEEEILKSGSSIGIHYDSRYLEEDRMIKDIGILEEVFEQKIKSGRAHYLIFDIKRSFAIYEKAGIKLDTSGSYADRIGFRFGTSYPFKPYNFEQKKEYDLLEVPLIVMDASLQNERYMNLSPQEGLEKTKELINKTKKYNGILTILWHNTSFYTNRWKEWECIYEASIKYARENGIQFINEYELIGGKF